MTIPSPNSTLVRINKTLGVTMKKENLDIFYKGYYRREKLRDERTEKEI